MSEVAARRRYLQDRNNWTVADMADRTGIPKRTLDQYLLRNDGSLPRFQAVCDRSKGLGVSLDWTVFRADAASEPGALYTKRAPCEVLMMFIECPLRIPSAGKKLFDDGDHFLGLTPIELAQELARRAGEVAQRLFKEGTSEDDLRTRRAAVYERTKWFVPITQHCLRARRSRWDNGNLQPNRCHMMGTGNTLVPNVRSAQSRAD